MLQKILNNNILMLCSVMGIVLLLLFLSDLSGCNGREIDAAASKELRTNEYTAASTSLTLVDFKKKYKEDSTVELGGIDKKIYFLNKRKFLSYAKASKQTASSWVSVETLIVDYLMKKSSLIKAVFGSDKNALKEQIRKNNSNIIQYFEKEAFDQRKIYELDNWNGLMVYRLNEGDFTKEGIEAADLLVENRSSTTKFKARDIPTSYKVTISNRLWQLKFNKVEEAGDSLEIVYEILGKHQHYNKKAVLDRINGTMYFESLGRAIVKQKNNGKVSIILDKGHYNFESLY